jgi:hypothetical protein
MEKEKACLPSPHSVRRQPSFSFPPPTPNAEKAMLMVGITSGCWQNQWLMELWEENVINGSFASNSLFRGTSHSLAAHSIAIGI